eukprot:scaffold24136_cov69-Phaeocystis_antarctica.AAC.3
MNVETCGHVEDLTVMAHAFAELRDGVVARPARTRFQMWAQFRSNPLRGVRVAVCIDVRGFSSLGCKQKHR